MMKKKWFYKNNNTDIVKQIVERLGVSQLTAAVLQNRLETIGKYVNKDVNSLYKQLYDPFLLKDMDKAVEQIELAVLNGEHITVYGDYDADGLTSTAILFTFLDSIGAQVDYYIPDRLKEGYGINQNAIDELSNRGTNLIITVDTGISAAIQIDYATSLGIKVIVTDHHECPEILPKCCAVVNPKQSGCNYPFKDIAGVGVAFKLVCALNDSADDVIESFIDLVCIGTVADVMPLVDENRIFAILGIKKMNNFDNLGINSLIECSGLKGKPVTCSTVGFVIAPRINACGRLYNASEVIKLFTTADYSTAVSISKWLDDINSERKSIETKIFNEAVSIIEQNKLYKERVIVVANGGWHHGVVGIVASKITEKYYRPSVLLCVEGDCAKGSGRSIDGFDLYEALTGLSDNLTSFGGHSLAAGISLKTENIVKFRNDINKYAAGVTTREDYIKKITIDYCVSPNELTEENILGLSVLEPFGNGNTSPIFALCGATVLNASTISDNKHLRLLLSAGQTKIGAIGFNMGDLCQYIKIGDMVDAAGMLDINEFNGQRSIQMILRDIKRSE